MQGDWPQLQRDWVNLWVYQHGQYCACLGRQYTHWRLWKNARL
jgi:hypothetical protein